MKFLKLSACLLLICLLFSSCASSGKINELTVVQALSVDKKEEKTNIAIQYLNLSSSDSVQPKGNITGVFTGEGENISSAVSQASQSIPDEIFFGQNKIIVFGMKYAQSSIDEGLEYLLKSRDSRPDVLAAISISDGEDAVKSKVNNSKIPAEGIYNLLRLGEENAQCAAVTVCELLNLYNDETSDIFLPVLKADENSVSCKGIAVFSNAKYAKALNSDETLGFLLIRNRVKNALLQLNTQTLGDVSLSLTPAKAKKSVDLKNNKITFNTEIRLKCAINETQLPIGKRLSENDYREIQKACENKIKACCRSAINECFKNKSDPFMTARYLNKEDTALYNSLKDNWRDNLQNINVEVDVEARVIKL